MSVRRWGRYEAENYLINPELLRRIVEGTDDLFSHRQTLESRKKVEEEFAATFPAALDRKGNARPVKDIKGSEWLVEVLARTHRPITKRDLYMLAERQTAEEIPPDVVDMLDTIAELAPLTPPALAANESAVDENGVDAPDEQPGLEEDDT